MNSTQKHEPTEAKIQNTAYHLHLWLESGCASGRELEHRLSAKELLKHHRGRETARNLKKPTVRQPPTLPPAPLS